MEDYKKEIVATRVGGFGSSDATLVRKVIEGRELSATDIKRVLVAKGAMEHEETFYSNAMEMGDILENAIFSALEAEFGVDVESNPMCMADVLSQRNKCNIFAHIDFALKTKDGYTIWIESKATKKSVVDTVKFYENQLAWEHLVGESKTDKFKLLLCHYDTNGIKDGDGFDAKRLTFVNITRAEVKDAYATLRKGLLEGKLGEYLANFEVERAIVQNDNLPRNWQDEVARMSDCLKKAKRLDEEISKMKAELLKYMEFEGIKQIKTDEVTISYKGESERLSIDSKVLKEKYPNAYEDCLRISKVKSSISVK